jgi:ABC-type Fe3+/spermidine/putrescine transport system ATPase subunit
LSGGEAQRVALARALAPQPGLLMLDEPLGSVDRTLKERLLAELSHILYQVSQTAIYVTHDQEEAFTIADRVVLLNKGKIEQIGLPQEIYSHPSSRFVAEFLGLSNLLPGYVTEILGNTRVSTPLGNFSFDTVHRGDVTVLIHPDGMKLGTQDDFQLAGKLIASTFRGNICRLTVEIAQEVLNFDFLSNEAIPKIGEMIYLNFDPARSLHVFKET